MALGLLAGMFIWTLDGAALHTNVVKLPVSVSACGEDLFRLAVEHLG